MRAVRSRDTSPERLVRSMAHKLGYRFRLCRRDLPGAPDLVFPRLRKVLFVHGCFWHYHRCAHGLVRPRTNARYWETKRAKTAARDRSAREALRKTGWSILTVWECQLNNQANVETRLRKFLKS